MADASSFSWPLFRELPLIGILRGQSAADCYAIAQVCADAGYHTLEVTMNTPGVATIIAELNRRFPELNVGAGTVCNLEDYREAVRAGARFIVTPILDEEVVRASINDGLPVFPGAFTPTEIYRAWSLGAAAVKVFPAGQLGPSYIKDVAGPLDGIRLLPTGGVGRENLRTFLKAGAIGAGMGSSLLDKALIRKRDFTGLKAHFLTIKADIADLLPLVP